MSRPTRHEFINVGSDLYVVRSTFKYEYIDRILQEFTAQDICDAYFVDKMFRGKNGLYFLVDKVEEAKIV